MYRNFTHSLFLLFSLFLVTSCSPYEPYEYEPYEYELYENEYETYLRENFSTLKTSIGETEFQFSVYEPTSINILYDLWVKVGYDYSFTNDLEYHRDVSDEMNKIVCQELKDHMEKIALALINKYPNKKFTGSYFSSGYEYPNIMEGYWSRKYYSWENYDLPPDVSYFDAEYSDSYVSDFQWTPNGDDSWER